MLILLSWMNSVRESITLSNGSILQDISSRCQKSKQCWNLWSSPTRLSFQNFKITAWISLGIIIFVVTNSSARINWITLLVSLIGLGSRVMIFCGNSMFCNFITDTIMKIAKVLNRLSLIPCKLLIYISNMIPRTVWTPNMTSGIVMERCTVARASCALLVAFIDPMRWTRLSAGQDNGKPYQFSKISENNSEEPNMW